MVCYWVIFTFTLPCVKPEYKDEDNIKMNSIGVGCEEVEWMQINHHPVAVYVIAATSLRIP
jgi:hypothetical protein